MERSQHAFMTDLMARSVKRLMKPFTGSFGQAAAVATSLSPPPPSSPSTNHGLDQSNESASLLPLPVSINPTICFLNALYSCSSDLHREWTRLSKLHYE